MICHKYREHLHKQLVLSRGNQLSFTCPISSIIPKLIAATAADGCLGYFLGLRDVWHSHGSEHSLGLFVELKLNPQKFHFPLSPPTCRTEVAYNYRTAYREQVGIRNFTHGHFTAGSQTGFSIVSLPNSLCAITWLSM